MPLRFNVDGCNPRWYTNPENLSTVVDMFSIYELQTRTWWNQIIQIHHGAVFPQERVAIAYVRVLGEEQALYLRQTTGDGDVQVLAPALGNFVAVTFSPDGNSLYF